MDLERVQNAHHLQSNDCARPVIGRSGTRDPTIQVTAKHYDFILQLGIRSGNLGNRVKSVLVISREPGFNVHLNRDRNLMLEKSKDPAIALDLSYHDGKGGGRIPVVRSAADRGTVIIKDDSCASAISAIAAGNDDACDLLVCEERKDLSGELGSPDVTFDARLLIGVTAPQR